MLRTQPVDIDPDGCLFLHSRQLHLKPIARNERHAGLLSPYPHYSTSHVMEQEHPIIAQFRIQAELLDIAGKPDELITDDLVVALASWMWLIEDRLTEDDMAVLIGIGGALFREGLRQRLNQRLGLCRVLRHRIRWCNHQIHGMRKVPHVCIHT